MVAEIEKLKRQGSAMDQGDSELTNSSCEVMWEEL